MIDDVNDCVYVCVCVFMGMLTHISFCIISCAKPRNYSEMNTDLTHIPIDFRSR